MPPRGGGHRTSPAPPGNALGASNNSTAGARGATAARGNATSFGRGRGGEAQASARGRGSTTLRRSSTRARGAPASRGRGSLQWKASSPDPGPPLPASRGLADARDPTKAMNKTAYMKHMSDLFQKVSYIA
jgi:hypothetical protein